jgi:cleavage and polyadenylation specificity factor subunit 2
VKILLDCGWCDPYDVTALKPLARVAKDIDFVLCTHPDMVHLGALPYAVQTLGLKCPIYVTGKADMRACFCRQTMLLE